jgi:outer membrane protein OmpA-like peptidoglycan-associated protein
VDITVKLPSGQQSTLRRGLSLMAANANAVCDKATIYFDLDSNTLRPDQRTALNALVPCLSRRTERIRLEGHTDERGTTDYNLALGQRRANAVREYLVSQGVPAVSHRLRHLRRGAPHPRGRRRGRLGRQPPR